MKSDQVKQALLDLLNADTQKGRIGFSLPMYLIMVDSHFRARFKTITESNRYGINKRAIGNSYFP